MENDVLLSKLDSLRRCIKRIEEKTPSNAKILKIDYDLQDILSVNLERAVQISVDIASRILSETETSSPTTMGESFMVLSREGVIPEALASNLRKAVGFRNISVHEYEKIDWDIVYSICTKRLDDFREYAQIALEYISQ